MTAAIFWLKTRGGWRETAQSHEVDLGVRKLSEITDAELERIIGTMQVAIADGAPGPGSGS